MSAQDLQRVPVAELPISRFLSEYVAANRPVIVTGALVDWNIDRQWTPAALVRDFGNELVQVYNNYFDLQTLLSLKQYVADYFDSRRPTREVVPYVRWYTQLRDQEFIWADEVFRKLQGRWSLPAFLPDTDYVLPLSRTDRRTDPVTDPFPAKGLFISPRGARTSLHLDPWGSCAVLCQLYGSKRWYLYAPDQARYLRNDRGVVDVTRPDLARFPGFAHAQVTATCTLLPGESIYVPHGWHHQVECETDAISLTWNFLHRTTVDSLVYWLESTKLSDIDESVLRFFYGIPRGPNLASQVVSRIGHHRKLHATAVQA